MVAEQSTIIQQTQDKLIQRLEPSGWSQKLGLLLQSQDFSTILETLFQYAQHGKHFTPGLKHAFRAFECCPFADTRVVILGQDPYPFPGVADGLAFSCSLTGKVQPSLRYMFEGINRLFPSETPAEQNPDLLRWANQGVLLLNSALTCEIGKPGSHQEIWRDFMIYVIDKLCTEKMDLVFVLMGKQAQTFVHHIRNAKVINTTHPASAAYAKAKQWQGADAFVEVNKYLESIGSTPVSWK